MAKPSPILVFSLVTCLGLGVVARLQQATLQQLLAQTPAPPSAAALRLQKSRLALALHLPTLGFSNLLADGAFLSFIQYFGDTPARNRTGYGLVPDYFQLIVRRDPRFVSAYLYLSTACSLYAGRPDRTVALMNQGLASLSPQVPQAYYLWQYKAVDELLFLGQPRTASQSYATGARWARIAGNDLVATSAQQAAVLLQHRPDSKQVQVGAWGMLLTTSPDPRVRALAVARIRALGGKVVVSHQDGALVLSVIAPKEN